MISKNLASPNERAPVSVKEETASTKCRHHPEFDLDTICFHPICREQRNQVICYCCGTEQQPHASHTSELYPIFKTSPAFRLVDFQTDPLLQTAMAQSQQDMGETLLAMQEMMNLAVESAKSRAQRRMQCLMGFFEKNGIFKICSRLRHYGNSHSDCCINFLNALKDLQERGPFSSQEAMEVARNELTRNTDELRSQLVFLRQQFQSIINKVFDINTSPLESPPNVQMSQLIPIEQAFQNLAEPPQEIQDISSKEEVIDVEQVRNSKPIIIGQHDGSNHIQNQIYSTIKQHKYRKAFRKNNQQNAQKRGKVMRLGNQENRNSPIVLDEEDEKPIIQAHQPQPNRSESIINELLNSRISDRPKSQMQLNYQSEEKSLQKVILWQQIRKWPKGTQPEGNDVIVIWNADLCFEAIVSFLSTATHVKHLIVEDKTIAVESELLKLIRSMPWLEGLHLHCQSQISNQILEELKTPYFSYFPCYRFIQILDLAKFFPKGDRTILEHLPPCLADNRSSRFRNVFIQSSDCSAIVPTTEEVNFVQDESQLFWVFIVGMEQALLKADMLLVLVFSNILIRKKVNLKPVYERHRSLHTIVFDDCQCQHDELISQLQYLRRNQLIHFQLTGDNLDHKIQLGSHEADEIFRHTYLQTLIITNVEFRSSANRKTGPHDSSRILSKIQNLAFLKHLNLFGSEPVYSDLLGYLNRRCHRSLRVLNLGCSQINASAMSSLEKFTQLQALGLDYTEIGENELLRATRKMPSLESLSIENLNGGRILYEEDSLNSSRKKYGLITSRLFDRLKYKTLRYINIYNCSSLAHYQWEKFSHLECLRVNKGLLTADVKAQLEEKGIKIYIDSVEENTSSFPIRNHSASPHHSTFSKLHVQEEEISQQDSLGVMEEKASHEAIVTEESQPTREEAYKDFKTFPASSHFQTNRQSAVSQASSKRINKNSR